MKDKNLQQLKKNYMDIPIPVELDFIVKKSLEDNGVKITNSRANFKGIKIAAASIAAAVALFTVGVNSSPVFAASLSNVPVVGSIVKILTFREYTVNEDSYNADIKVPSIQGLENKDLENSLNDKYLTENKKLYEEFIADMEDMKNNGDGHLGVSSGYVVKTDNDKLLSIGRYVVNTVGSSSTTMKYDTIDKQSEILITLPSLFKNDSYVNIISENIKKQIEKDVDMDLFEKISKDQNFYINSEGKLVISFDKYEVAPGYMGVVEFVIPTEILSDSLVSNEYIK